LSPCVGPELAGTALSRSTHSIREIDRPKGAGLSQERVEISERAISPNRIGTPKRRLGRKQAAGHQFHWSRHLLALVSSSIVANRAVLPTLRSCPALSFYPE